MPAVAPEIPAGVVCTCCSYDLRGLPPGWRCPECGTRTEYSLPGAPPPRTEEPDLAAGVVCTCCSYDLRGLPPGGVCPECGTPTERSPGGDPLSRADPQWLTRIAQGQALLAWGLLVAWLGAIMFGFMPVALHYIGEAGRGGNASWRMIEMAPVPVTGCVVMGMMMCTVGAFLLTTREPKKRGRETRSPARQLARQGMFATIGGVWLLLVVGLAPLTPGALNTIRVVLCPFSVVALIVAIGALLRFLAGLAARIPDRKLLRRTNKAMRPLCWAVAVLVGIVLLALWPASSRDLLAMVVWVAGAGCGVLIIVGLIIQQIARLLGLMHAYRRAFRRCREAAAA
ncbi:MAG: hypothetical protein ACYTGE_02170 [Planctomycetota bacterium]